MSTLAELLWSTVAAHEDVETGEREVGVHGPSNLSSTERFVDQPAIDRANATTASSTKPLLDELVAFSHREPMNEDKFKLRFWLSPRGRLLCVLCLVISGCSMLFLTAKEGNQALRPSGLVASLSQVSPTQVVGPSNSIRRVLGSSPPTYEDEKLRRLQDASRVLQTISDNKPPSKPTPLGKCQGDCDSDADCKSGLECFQRDGNKAVPGCFGLEQDGTDYCYEPVQHIPAGVLVLTGDNGNPKSSFPLGICQGDCDSDAECEQGLKCFPRDAQEPVPGCIGLGEESRDYCYLPLDDLVFIADNEPNSSFPLGVCEGDCDWDFDCEPGLKCLQRKGNENVPGCSGQGDVGRDYCYLPPKPVPLGVLVLISEEEEDIQPVLLEKCQGDCEVDSDCQPGLNCFQRDWNKKVPGCYGEAFGTKDYCISESPIPTPSPTATPPKKSLPPSSEDTSTQTVFCAIADVPYGSNDARKLPDQIASLDKECEFLIHIGDIFGRGDCKLKHYNSTANSMLKSPKPVFIVPGDNEWNDCPDVNGGIKNWFKTFNKFEDNWNHDFAVEHASNRPENFKFVHGETLFVGLNIVGGRIIDKNGEWIPRLTEQAEWTKDLIRLHTGGNPNLPRAKGVVIFGHGYPNGNYRYFFHVMCKFMREPAMRDIPVLYLHGDSHMWLYETNYFGQSSFLRVMMEGGTRDPVLKIIADPAKHGGNVQKAFKFDRGCDGDCWDDTHPRNIPPDQWSMVCPS